MKTNYEQISEIVKNTSDEEILKIFENNEFKVEIVKNERLYKLFLTNNYYITGSSLNDLYRQTYYKFI